MRYLNSSKRWIGGGIWFYLDHVSKRRDIKTIYKALYKHTRTPALANWHQAPVVERGFQFVNYISACKSDILYLYVFFHILVCPRFVLFCSFIWLSFFLFLFDILLLFCFSLFSDSIKKFMRMLIYFLTSINPMLMSQNFVKYPLHSKFILLKKAISIERSRWWRQ